ncbi:MAG: cyanase [Actinomycetota bacterium]|nr:cyanase [Actinomycetota bacterium]
MQTVSKSQAAEAVKVARIRAGLTWRELAALVAKPTVWTVSALLGQHPISAEDADIIGKALGLDPAVIAALEMQPTRGSGTAVRADPTVYRFYEALDVYAPAIKELIHEEFGDGIMSAINFKVEVSRREDPTGDRVVVTFDGKFLDYRW